MPRRSTYPRSKGFRFAVLLGLVCVAGALVAADDQTGPPRAPRNFSERQPFVVGTTSDSFPYGYVDRDGRWTGFAVDLLDAVARVMDFRIRREVDAGIRLHARFRAGEFDLLQAYSQTPEREEYTDFSVPYLTLQGCVFVRKTGSPIKDWADFNGRPFAIIGQRSIGEKFLRDRGLTVKPVYVSSSEEGLRLVNSGECAGVFVSYLTAVSVIDSSKLTDVKRFGEPVPDYDIRHCFAVHKGDAQLLARINEGLAVLQRTGEYRKIYDKWFGRFESPVFTREQMVGYVAGALALALAATTWGFLRQRALRRRIARQAAELIEQEALLKALYDNIPMAMMVVEESPEGHRVLTINRQAEAYLGILAKSAAGQLLSSMTLDAEWRQHLEDILRRWPSGNDLVREEHKLAAAHKNLVIALAPLPASAEGRRRVCVLTEDVTQRRELDEEVSQSRKLRAVGELVGGIAHEFNNLLTPVMLQLGEIQAERARDTALLQSLDVVSRAMTRAAELTRRLLTFGRRAERRSDPVKLSTIAGSCFELLRQTVDRRIVLDFRIPENLPPLVVNSTDLHQVLLNLLLNARDTLLDKLVEKPSGWTPVIRVEALELPTDAVVAPARSQGRLLGWQRLVVRDNGQGMTAEVRERIFEPFYTTKEVGRGSGLGLATVWHVVTDSGGKVEVESTPGQGSAFHVYLPVWATSDRQERGSVAPMPTSAETLRILLAEDDGLVARTVIASLERTKHAVTHFLDGQTAWTYLQTHAREFDLLIFDVNMPGIDGIELARRVRGGLAYRGTILIMSGRVTSDDLDSLAEANVNAVLPKPFTPDQLVEAVRRARRNHSSAPGPVAELLRKDLERGVSTSR